MKQSVVCSWLILVVLLFAVVATAAGAKSAIRVNSQSKPHTSSAKEADNLLNIWVVAHTHDDTGWLRTVDNYYEYEVAYILDTVVTALLQNPNRKFIYVEMGFFERWWNDQTQDVQDSVRKLVKNGQLQFVLGGYCMNDEAVTAYDAEINQMTEGHEFLVNTFGAIPKIAWHIDPFGASSVTPSLWAEAGFDAFVINRMDWRLKADFIANQTLEFVWRGSKSLGASTQMFTHVLDSHYCTPDGFDWEHGVTQDLPEGDGPPVVITHSPSPITPVNVQTIADQYVAMAKQRAAWYRTPNVLIPFGCDFNFQNAFMKYKNMDKLIDYINANSATYGVRIQYSVLTDYFQAVNEAQVQWQVWETDFFPYADNSESYWTGFYTSRPTVKALSRASDALMYNAEVLYSLTQASHYIKDASSQLANLVTMRTAEALAQHHDAVTGTERANVAEDYSIRLNMGAAACESVIEEMVSMQLSTTGTSDASLSVDPSVLASNLKSGATTPVVVFNPLGWTRSQYIKVASLPIPNIQVTQSNGSLVQSQVNPSIVNPGTYDLWFLAEALPPMGFETFFISTSRSKKAAARRAATVTTPAYGAASFAFDNEHITVTFDGTTGQIARVFNKHNKQNLTLTQDFIAYIPTSASQTSGAYIFRPEATSQPYEYINPVKYTVIKGACVDEIYQQFDFSNIIQVIRIFRNLDEDNGGGLIYTESTIPSIDVSQGGREIVTRFYMPDIDNNGVFFTDNNAMELQCRTRLPNGRPGDADSGVALSGNYYPITSRAFIRDNETQLTVLTASTHGGSSLADGMLELMLHRRLIRDDGRGVGEPLNDNSTAQPPLWLLVSDPKNSPRLHRTLANYLQYPCSVLFGNGFFTPLSQYSYNTVFAPLSADLPKNVRIVSLKARAYQTDQRQIIFRLLHLFEVDEDPVLSQPVSINLANLFSKYTMYDIEERTLTMNQPKAQAESNKLRWRTVDEDELENDQQYQLFKKFRETNIVNDDNTIVTLTPMQIRSFFVKLK